MNAGPLAIFRADASPAIGAGHVMRCLTLADALAERGWQCSFAGSSGTSATVAALRDSDHEIQEMEKADDSRVLRDAWPDGCDLLVVDHYGLDAAFESPCRGWAKRILIIDDLADRPHDCDVLVDQTAGRSGDDYRQLVPSSCRILTGSAYALLRPQFAAAREAALTSQKTERPLQRVLISCGATDPHNITATVLDGLELAAPGLKVDVALGAAAPHLLALRQRVDQLALSVDIHIDREDIAGLMLQADLAIGAAGTSAWERCCMALPTLMVVSADNQLTVARNLLESGAAMLIGNHDVLTPDAVAGAFRKVSVDSGRLADMSAAAALQCNGLGAKLLASVLDPYLSGDGNAVFLRPVTSADSGTILAWQQRPETRRFSHNPSIPTAGEHAAWMAGRLKDPGCIFLMVLHGDEPAGVLRLDRTEKPNGAGDGYRVSIFLSPVKYHLGIATAALLLAKDLMPHARLIAEVLPDNQASHALFNKAGFEKHDGYYTWEMP